MGSAPNGDRGRLRRAGSRSASRRRDHGQPASLRGTISSPSLRASASLTHRRTLPLDVVRRHETSTATRLRAGEGGIVQTNSQLAIGHPWNVVAASSTSRIAAKQVQLSVERACKRSPSGTPRTLAKNRRRARPISTTVIRCARRLQSTVWRAPCRTSFTEIDRRAGRVACTISARWRSRTLRSCASGGALGQTGRPRWAAMRRHSAGLSARTAAGGSSFVSGRARLPSSSITSAWTAPGLLRRRRARSPLRVTLPGSSPNSFEAMTTDRPVPGQGCHTRKGAREIESMPGPQFHPRSARAFVRG